MAGLPGVTNLESQRVVAVLGEMIDRLNLLDYVPLSADSDVLEELNEAGCQGISALFQALWQLEEGTSVMLQRAGSSTSVGRAVPPMENSVVTELKQQLYSASRGLSRALRDNPVAIEVLYSLKQPRVGLRAHTSKHSHSFFCKSETPLLRINF